MDERLRDDLLEKCFRSNRTEGETPFLYWIEYESKRLGWPFVLDDIVFEHYGLSLILAIVYALLTLILLHGMKNRKAIPMKKFALCWHGTVGVLNALILTRILPHMLITMKREGFYVSLCTDKTFVCDVVSAFWAALFPYLKVLELGDVFILALQKRPIPLFVWTHHLLALIASWHLYPYYPAIGQWYMATVSFPHIFIYVYLFLKELDIALPKTVPAAILLIEFITQIWGSTISALAFGYAINGRSCALPMNLIILINVVWMICVVLCAVFLRNRCKKYWGAKLPNNPTITRL